MFLCFENDIVGLVIFILTTSYEEIASKMVVVFALVC